MIRTTGRVLVTLGAILALVLVACQTESEARVPAEIPRESILVVGTVEHNPEAHQKRLNEYQPFIDYLVSQLDGYGISRGEVVIAESPVEMAKYIRQRKVDIVFEGSFSSFVIEQLASSEPLLSRWKEGVEKYNSVLFTKHGSGITSLDDLKGRTIVFDNPSSSAGYFLPKAHLITQGYELREKAGPKDTVAADEIGYYFAGDDKKMMEDVLNGAASAGADKQADVAEFLEESGQPKDTFEILSSTIRVFRQLVSVRPDMNQELKQGLKELMIRMDTASEGQVVLKEFNKTEKFALLEPNVDEAFQAIRQHVELLEKEIVQR